RQPNVVFILADDLGYGDVGCFGNDHVHTPHLDELARDGVALTQHYSASPLCAPARAALLTGRYNHRTGAVDVPSNRGLDRIHLSERTMADHFAAAGYVTGMAGKWHNGLHDLRYHPRSRGFDEFTGFLNGGMDYYNWTIESAGREQSGDGRYLTDVFTDAATDFIGRYRHEPFFLYLAYNAPHLPLQAPAQACQRFEGLGLSDEVSTLYAMVEAMDAGIGRVMEALDAHGLTQDTIVVFTSDNGPQFGGGLDRDNGPFCGAKGDALEGGIRVPAIVRAPAWLPSGLQAHDMIHFCDWLPTLTGLCGIPEVRSLDGYDCTCRLRGESGDIPDIRFWQRNRYEPIPHCNAAMRDGPWKLVWPMREGADWKDPVDQAPYEEGLTSPHQVRPLATGLPHRDVGPASAPRLFHIDEDPCEMQDLSAAQPARVAAMTRTWDAWFDEILAQWHTARADNLMEHSTQT
ncbi:MAG: sulfatase-like hydrolase/transferase, partial [Gemmatimonadetes bacterium]|nr:sulfatase-like hydrolase/transferase [Gemmatimonadota bacterium]